MIRAETMRRIRFLPLLVLAAAFGLASPTVSDASTVVVTNAVHVKTITRLNPGFWPGNLDDPAPPDDYRPGGKLRLGKWRLRNPGHNFDFYVIGVADKTFRRTGRYPDQVFKPGKGWNWTVSKYKFLRLPFLSYIHGRFKFYAGWRERGNFGLELKF
jgi:hypothetical protein